MIILCHYHLSPLMIGLSLTLNLQHRDTLVTDLENCSKFLCDNQNKNSNSTTIEYIIMCTLIELTYI